jgi:uncharacterized protein with HEPN domain
MKDPRVYVIHIRDCIARIEQYTTEGESVFFEDIKTQDAVIRNLEVMCESIALLPEEWKNYQPEMDWSGMNGFRNVLAHQYLGLELDSIWNIVQNYLPELSRAVEAIAEEFWNQ